VDGSDPLTPVERLFMEAGYSRTLYMAWRLSILSSLKTMSRMARLASGWPSDAIDEEAEELKLAKGWLEGEARRAAAAREKRAAEEETSRSRDGTDAVFGPVMTTSEAKELIQQEIEGGRPVSLKAFENALRRAAKTARDTPEDLPLQLGGQHKDWQLVELGPESGGHGKGHRLRRRVTHTATGGNRGL
jgi:hypothetical protein